jgi:purine-binding chemotaxis protein CheW
MVDRQQSTRQQIRKLEQELKQLKLSLVSSSTDPATIAFPIEALVLHAGGFVFAVDVVKVEEVCPMVLVSPLPRAPGSIRGSINYRGRLVAILDLRFALTGEHSPLNPEMLLIIVSADSILFGIAVDRVEDVRAFDSEDVESAADIPFPPSIVPCLLSGQPGAIALLDPPGLLTASELNLLLELLSELRSGDEEPGQ